MVTNIRSKRVDALPGVGPAAAGRFEQAGIYKVIV